MIHIYHHIWIGGVGLEIAEQQKNRLFNSITDEFIYHPNVVDVNQHEGHTLLKMLDGIKEFDNEDYILYIHTKGASKPNELYEIEWRGYMELSLIDDYKTHINLIDNGFDTSGVLMANDELQFIRHWAGGFYGGNFWWTKVKLLNRIPKNIKEIWGTMEDRHMPEWCFLNKIENWKPGIVNPSFENFKHFYDHIEIVTKTDLAKQYITGVRNWEDLYGFNKIPQLNTKTTKSFI